MKRAVNRFIPRKLGSSVAKKLDLNSIQEFYILLEDPHRVFLPGDHIKGELFLILNKNLVNATIDLSLSGSIKVKNSMSTNSFRSKKKVLFEHVIRIYPIEPQEQENGQQQQRIRANDYSEDHVQSGLTKGQHIFPFIAKLPEHNIFTSIAFEKGGISYKLKGSIGEISGQTENPSFSCEKFLTVVKPLDVGRLPPAKVKTLVVKYPTKKLKKTFSQTSVPSSDNNTTVTSTPNTNNKMDGTGNSEVTPATQTSSPGTPNQHTTCIEKSKIKLSVEIPTLGYLRGELIPVKVSLQHIKSLKNLNGIIITLIRICKVDFGPDGPVQSYRKDLSQTIAPLFVDPSTFKANVTSSVRIPADVFPTILADDMIRFQYAIEVIVNLSNSKNSLNYAQHEKIHDDENLDELHPGGGAQGSGQSVSAATSPGGDYHSSGMNGAVVSDTIFNVDKLKRMKHVLTLNSEVVIGTTREESYQRPGTRNAHRASFHDGISQSGSSNTAASTPLSNDHYDQPPPIHYEPPSAAPVVPAVPPALSTQDFAGAPSTIATIDASPPAFLQEAPDIPQFSNLTEKQLLQLKEQTLLPSEPVFGNESSNSTGANTEIFNIPGVASQGNSASYQDRQSHILHNSETPALTHHSASSSVVVDYVPMYEEAASEVQGGSSEVIGTCNQPAARTSSSPSNIRNDNNMFDDNFLYTTSRTADTRLQGNGNADAT